jgi:hypothetical protein
VRLDGDEVVGPTGAGVLHNASRQGHAGGSQRGRMVVDPSGRSAGGSKPVCHSFRRVGTGSSGIPGEVFPPFGGRILMVLADECWTTAPAKPKDSLRFRSTSSTFTLSSETQTTSLIGMRHLFQGVCPTPVRGGTARSQRRRHRRHAAAGMTNLCLHASHETGRVSSPRGLKRAAPPGATARCLVRADAAHATVRFPGCALPSVMRGASHPWTTSSTG